MHDFEGTVVLRRGVFVCTLAPLAGGAIARWTIDTPAGVVDLMRPGRPGAVAGGPAFDLSCFPLVPFSNRIDEGRFRFNGRLITLPVDRWNRPHAIHGHGWEAAWLITGKDTDRLELTYRHPGGAWPWPYRAEQTFHLTETGLAVTLAIENEGDEPMPAGIGLHPYFPKPPGTILTARTDTVWANGPTRLPERRMAVPPAWDASTGLVLDDVDLDHGFAGWNGSATLAWPSRGLSLSVEADPVFGHLLVYAPRGEGYVCVEPVSHMTDALNHTEEPDSGICVLSPGNRLSGCVCFSINVNMGLV